jgi:hypothetical protein
MTNKKEDTTRNNKSFLATVNLKALTKLCCQVVFIFENLKDFDQSDKPYQFVYFTHS